MKPRKFGKVIAFEYIENGGKTKPGVSIKLDSGSMVDQFDGEWIRLPEAKKLHAQLGKAIAHIEAKEKG